MSHFLARNEMIQGKLAIEKLKNASVCLLGVGGVGSYVAEGLVRSGVGHLTLVDNDVVEITNINRQLVALHSTIGKNKVDVMGERALDINPDLDLKLHQMFYLKKEDLDFSKFHYVVDAIDTVTGKLAIISACAELNIPLISAMGCGNRLDPSKLKIGDIYETSNCPLCKVMRKELHSLHIESLKVLYSTEPPIKPHTAQGDERTPGSVAFVPGSAGLMLAAEVVRYLTHM